MSKIGYARVSTRVQNEESQVDLLTAEGCDKIFIDDGVSGKYANRPEWDACMAYLRSGDTLVITRLSRAMRSLKQLLEVSDDLRERGIELKILRQAIDTTTKEGRLLFAIIGAIDEFQRELIVEGTLEGLAAARARGRVGGGQPKLKPAQKARARVLYEAKGPDGKRLHTVAEIGAVFGVSRQTIYRALEDTEPVAELVR